MGTEAGDFNTIMNDFDPKFISKNKALNTQNFISQEQLLNLPISNITEVQSSNTSHDDNELYSSISFDYTSQMLLNEDNSIDQFFDNSFNEFLYFEDAEKPFYEMLEKNYMPEPIDTQPELNISSNSISSVNPSCDNSNSSSASGDMVLDYNWPYDYLEHHLPLEFTNQSSFGSTNNVNKGEDYDKISDLFLQNSPSWYFNKGVEEARKFLPKDVNFVIDLEANDFPFPLESKVESKPFEVKSEDSYSLIGSKGRKNPHSDDLDINEGRSVEQSTILFEENVRSKMFDDVLLCYGSKFSDAINGIRDRLQHVTVENSQNGHGRVSRKGKRRGKKQSEDEIIDLNTLLIQCAQMVAAGDQHGTNELLKQIRQHSSPTGDGTRRLAHYFANGLEARLGGNGSEIYNSYGMPRRSTSDFLKAYRLYFAACPFKKISQFFSNQTILNVSENATSVHIIDFGINFGFQWPSLIQRFYARPGGPPKLRITGIDAPQPGFRLAEKIKETSRRLVDYANSFNVPFEYKSIASKWEEVRIEDLDIRKGEVLIVNCLNQMRFLADESVIVDSNSDSPRNMVLNNVRKMNPNVFILGIVNGSYSAPFFVTRFREAIYHFSALFDLLETIVPREDEQRLLIEREIFGRDVLNVIACEGLERVERPETYKQWQVRNLRAGFVQHPVEDIMKKARDKVKTFYHKDFDVDENGRWLLQGWRGRIVYALSSWKPS